MEHFRVRRIETPVWSKPPTIERVNLTAEDFQGLQLARDLLLRRVHNEVEQYLNNPALVFRDSPDDFPSLLRLSGEYYVSKELYERLNDESKVLVGIKTRFLEKPWFPGQVNCDYLGLTVWLAYDPDTSDFDIWRNTDSMVL